MFIIFQIYGNLVFELDYLINRRLLIIKPAIESDLSKILELQQINLRKNLELAELEKEGYVTVEHSQDQLKSLHVLAPSIVAMKKGQLAGYCLAMTKESKLDIPVLIPMFEKLNTVSYQGIKLEEQKYIVCGQVCIAKAFRGNGLFKQMYDALWNTYKMNYDCLITEIANDNQRSLSAHLKIGFKELIRYTSDQVEWIVVVYDQE